MFKVTFDIYCLRHFFLVMGLLSFRVCSLETFQYDGNIRGVFRVNTLSYNGQLVFVIIITRQNVVTTKVTNSPVLTTF